MKLLSMRYDWQLLCINNKYIFHIKYDRLFLIFFNLNVEFSQYKPNQVYKITKYLFVYPNCLIFPIKIGILINFKKNKKTKKKKNIQYTKKAKIFSK